MRYLEGTFYETATMGLEWESIEEMFCPAMERGAMKRKNELDIMIKCHKLADRVYFYNNREILEEVLAYD